MSVGGSRRQPKVVVVGGLWSCSKVGGIVHCSLRTVGVRSQSSWKLTPHSNGVPMLDGRQWQQSRRNGELQR
jgi:hypothetical protein